MPQKPKLTIVSQLFYPEMVSTGQTLTELALELNDQGVDVDVICGQPTVSHTESVEKHIEYNGINIRRIWSTQFPKLNIFGKLMNHLTFTSSAFIYLFKRRFSKQKHTPMLVLTNPPMLGIAAVFQRLLGGSKFMYLVFDVYPETAIRAGLLNRFGLISLIWSACNRLVIGCASKVIVIGRCMKKLYPFVPSKKIEHIHVWADDTMIQAVTPEGTKKTSAYIQKWNLKDKFVVMYSGNLARFHDMETIMEAAHLLQDDPNITFLFVGEGHKKQLCMDIAKEKNLTNCTFDTYVPKEDLPYSLRVADIGLVSLQNGQEGLSVPSKTYGLLAAGVPVLAVMPEGSEIAMMLTESKSGVVIKNKDAKHLASTLLELKNNKEQLDTMQKNAKSIIQNTYSLKIAAKKYVDLLRALQT